jgi:hypothetical protein
MISAMKMCNMPIYKKKDPVVKEIHGRWEWGTEILDHTG